MGSRHTLLQTVLGELTLVADGESLSGLYFPGHSYMPQREALGAAVELAADPLLSKAATQLKEYLAEVRQFFDLPYAPRGDAFRKRVWKLLEQIPYGQTTTYGELAELLGNKSLAQTVGQAIGHNPLSIFIPCHRVVGKGGKLTGYAGGLERKSFLLELEEPALVKSAKLF